MVVVIHTRSINRGAARRGRGRGAGMGLGPRRSPSKSRNSIPHGVNSRSMSNPRRDRSPSPNPVPIERQSEEETEPTEDKNPSQNPSSSKKESVGESEPSVDYSPATPASSSDVGNQALQERIEMLEGAVSEVIERLDRIQHLSARPWKSKVADRWSYHRGVAQKYGGLIVEFLKEWYGRKPPIESFWHRRPTQKFEEWLEARHFLEDEP